MGWLQFIASIVQSIVSLAWPAAFVVAVWLFRGRLTSLLPLLRVKHKDWEASFRLDEAEKEVAALPPGALKSLPTPEEKSRFDKLAEISPRAAMLEVRAEIEAALRTLALQAGIPAQNMPLGIITRLLRTKGLIEGHTSALIDDLTKIGNSAAHNVDFDITQTATERYRKLADLLLGQIASITPP